MAGHVLFFTSVDTLHLSVSSYMQQRLIFVKEIIFAAEFAFTLPEGWAVRAAVVTSVVSQPPITDVDVTGSNVFSIVGDVGHYIFVVIKHVFTKTSVK